MNRPRNRSLYLAIVIASGSFAGLLGQGSSETPVNFKIAFIGDQGLGEDAVAVLNLIYSEGAEAVVHSGDFDLEDNPAGWDAQINGILGEDFPYFAAVGQVCF